MLLFLISGFSFTVYGFSPNYFISSSAAVTPTTTVPLITNTTTQPRGQSRSSWSLGTISLLYLVEAAISGFLVAGGIIFAFTRLLKRSLPYLLPPYSKLFQKLQSFRWSLSYLVPNYFKNSSPQTIKLYILTRQIIIAFTILILETSTIPIINMGLVFGYGLGVYVMYWLSVVFRKREVGLIAWNTAGVTGAIVGMIATGDYRMCLACVPLDPSTFGLAFGSLAWPLANIEFTLFSILGRKVETFIFFFFTVMLDMIITAVVDGVIIDFNAVMGV